WVGSARMVVLYAGCAVMASQVSCLVGDGAISVGASGPICGLLGAAISLVAWRRVVLPEAWRRTLLLPFGAIALLELVVSFVLPTLDKGAHVGGFVAGLALALVIAPPSTPPRRAARAVYQGLATIIALAVAGSFAQAANTTLEKTL